MAPSYVRPSRHAKDLLQTKLEFPLVGARIVRRNRLTNLLTRVMDRQVALMVAPAGYGKTTLLGEWLSTVSASDWRIAWVSLDIYDNAPSRFWCYIVAALHKIHPKFQFDVDKIPCDEHDFTSLVQINPLLNEVGQIPDRICLVLDDYQTITNPAIHHSLGYLIAHLPRNLHLILSSRVVPPIPFSRMRVQGQLLRITAKDLSFTLDETETFFAGIPNLEVEQERIRALWETTEGWADGLRVAALSLKSQHDFYTGTTQSPGELHHVFDYMTEEVLDQQDEETREFLLKTSILKEFSAPLCDAVLGQSNSQEILSRLEQSNLFIVALEEKYWYRYHPLFNELLGTEVERKFPHLILDLHRKACCWLNEHNFPQRAVEHALTIGDLETAAEIVDACAMQAIIRFDFSSLVRWISRFSDEIIWNRPQLGIYYALANYLLGRLDQVEPKLMIVEQALDKGTGNTENEELVRWKLAAIRAALDCVRGDYVQGISRSRILLQNVPRHDAYFYGFLNHFAAYAYECAGDLDTAADAFSSGCEFAAVHHYPYEYVFSRCELARVRKKQGRLRVAEREYRQALDYAVRFGLDMEMTTFVQSGLAEIAVDRHDLQAAENWMREGMSCISRLQFNMLSWVYTVTICSRYARYYLAQNDIETARFYSHKAKKNLRDFSQLFYHLLSDVTDIQVLTWLNSHELETARGWLQKELAISQRGTELSMAEKLAICRIHLALHEAAKALPILAELEVNARNFGRGERLIEILILRSLSLTENAHQAEAFACLDEALRLAEPEGYIHVVIENGEPMRALLSEYARLHTGNDTDNGTLPTREYLQRLLTTLQSKPQTIGQRALPLRQLISVSPVLEPLSDRELQVFGMLAKGKSAKDVATELIVSVNTAKSHIKSIYRKLNVHSQTAVSLRAKELSLIQ